MKLHKSCAAKPEDILKAQSMDLFACCTITKYRYNNLRVFAPNPKSKHEL